MSRSLLIAALLSLGLFGHGHAAERWERLDLPPAIAEASVSGLGAAQFPDGGIHPWVGTEQGLYRRTAGGWQPWPDNGGPLRDITSIEFGPGPDGQTSWWLGSREGLWLFTPDSGLRRLTADDSPLIEQPINTLHFDQARGQGADLWIGGDGGLVIWQQGRWTPISARPDGFPGGQVRLFRRLAVDEHRERWVVSSEGLGRYVRGQWSRPATECLRGRQPLSAETVELLGALHLVVGTTRGLFLLDFEDTPACRPIDITAHSEQAVAARALVRDAEGRLYLFHDAGVERWHLDRSQVGHWTGFDERDGLDADIEWTGPTHRDTDGTLWAGSTTGVWQFQPQTAPTSRAPSIVVELNGERLSPGSNPVGLFTRSARIEVSSNEGQRAHAIRFALSLNNQSVQNQPLSWSTGRLERSVALPSGESVLSVDVIDAWGVMQGPFEYRLVRPSPLPWVILLFGLGLTAIVMAWLLRRHR